MGKIETATQWMIDLATTIHMVMTRILAGVLTMTAPLPSFLHGNMQVFR